MATITHQVSAPDGTILNIEAPEGAEMNDILQYAKDVAYPAYLKEQEEANKPASLAQRGEDILVSGGRGVLSGLQMISDAFGADNKASQAIKSADTYLSDLLSAQAKRDDKEIARIIADAKDKGVWENVKAGLSALSVAPARTVVNALGQAAPFALAALTSEISVPIGVAAEAGLGVATGLGATKDKIYNDVKQQLIDSGVSPDAAEKTAQQAQAYDGQNLDQIITGGLVGAGAMAVGPAGMLGKRIAGRILGTEAAEAEAGVVGRAVAGGAKGAAAMGTQAAQTQIAANIAAQREGLETPTFEGVSGEATQAAILGGLLGGGTEAVLARKAHPVHEDLGNQDDALRSAIELYNKDRNAPPEQGPMLLLEDQTGKRLLQFAEDHRDTIPVLGTILDSNTPRDIKIELIKEKIGSSYEFQPNPPVEATTGRVALPEPEKGSVTPHEAYNMLVDSGAPLNDLRYEQTPGGNLRLMSGEEKVLTAPIRFRSERDANMLIEALRREHDMRQEAGYEDLSQDYKKKQHAVTTAALAAAAREVNTPLYPVTLADVGKIDSKLVETVRLSRQRQGVKDVEAPATIDELRQRGASRDTIDKLTVDQKPITGGGDSIRPEYIEQQIGPRPSEPAKTARTEEQLGKLEMPKVISKTDEEAARRPERPVYPEIPKEEAPSQPNPEDVAKAKALIQDRLDKVRGYTDQGKAISDALQKALDGGEFTPDQMVAAFNAADTSARLLGKTMSDPHAFEFLNRVMFGSEEAYGLRRPPSETLQGLVQLSLAKRKPSERQGVSLTAAHEAFHVLQDILAKYDPAGSKIIKDAFKGAKSFDDIKPNLLDKLKRIKDPDTGKSIYQALKDDVKQKIFDDLGDNQVQRERELQAYVFEYLDNALSKGVKMTGLGNAFTRLLNYIMDFKERFGNLLKGQGYLNAEDVFRQVSRGERQAGLGEEGVRVKKEGVSEPDLSRAAEQTGTNAQEFNKWWNDSKAVDENGQPARWYSGTHGLNEKGEPFKIFDKAQSGAIPGKKGPFFFSRNPRFAQEFAERNLSKSDLKGSKPPVEAGRMIPAFLSAKNPFDYENPEHVARILKDPDVRYAVDRGTIFPSFIREGMWQTMERGVIQNAIRKAGFDGFFVKERLDRTFKDENGNTQYLPGSMEEKNLAVFDPKQIKGVFNKFEPGTAESPEFSRAIKATGQEEEARVNSERFRRMWDKTREFFYPLALVNKVEDYLKLRNITQGSTTISEREARRISDNIAKGTKEDKDAVYNYLTTRNADPGMIKDLNVRKAAVEAKQAINKMAKELIDAGMLTQESFDKYYDQYLPRLYLYHIVNGRGLKTPYGGISAQEYLTARNEELTKEARDILGEVKDPAFLTYVAISRPARDLAMTKMLHGVMNVGSFNDYKWVAPNFLIDYKGQKLSPYTLLDTAAEMRMAAEVAKNLSPDQVKPMMDEALTMEKIANDKIKEIGGADFKLEGYTKMPEDRRYGVLRGAIVQNGIYNDLVGTFMPVGKQGRPLLDELFSTEHSKLTDITQLWKLGKTVLNPPTQVTNFISNAIALNIIGGVKFTDYPRLFSKALTDMKNGGELWKQAQRFGIEGGTMSSAEMGRALARLKNTRLMKDGVGGSLSTVIAGARELGIALSKGVEKAGDIYQKSEAIFKYMKFLDHLDNIPKEQVKNGKFTDLQYSDAVNSAHDTLFDYSLVNRNIRWLRSTPLGLPFITYQYKVLPKLVQTLYEHPGRFVPYVGMMMALPMATAAAFNIKQDELEKLRKSMAEYMRDNGSMFILPIRDSKGNPQFVDIGNMFPFSVFTDPLITSLKYGEPGKAAKKFIGNFTPGGPLVTAIAALETGVDPFTGKPIMDPRDSAYAQFNSMLSYVYNQALPPVLNIDLNNMDHSGGALARVYNGLFVDGTGLDKKGQPRPEVMESIARLFGINLTPFKPELQSGLNMQSMMNQIQKSRGLATQIQSDQSMTPEKRRERIADIYDKIAKMNKELADYAQSVGGVGEIAKRIREKQ